MADKVSQSNYLCRVRFKKTVVPVFIYLSIFFFQISKRRCAKQTFFWYSCRSLIQTGNAIHTPLGDYPKLFGGSQLDSSSDAIEFPCWLISWEKYCRSKQWTFYTISKYITFHFHPLDQLDWWLMIALYNKCFTQRNIMEPCCLNILGVYPVKLLVSRTFLVL